MSYMIKAGRVELRRLADAGHDDAKRVLEANAGPYACLNVLAAHGVRTAALKIEKVRVDHRRNLALMNAKADQGDENARASRKRKIDQSSAWSEKEKEKISRGDPLAIAKRDLRRARYHLRYQEKKANNQMAQHEEVMDDDNEFESGFTPVLGCADEVMTGSEDDWIEAERSMIKREHTDNIVDLTMEDDAPVERTVKEELKIKKEKTVKQEETITEGKKVKTAEIIAVIDISREDEPSAPTFEMSEIELEMKRSDARKAILAEDKTRLDLEMRLLRMKKAGQP